LIDTPINMPVRDEKQRDEVIRKKKMQRQITTKGPVLTEEHSHARQRAPTSRRT
jgi:hypothetical protein